MDFLQTLRAAGIATTQAELETAWRGVISSAGLAISNDSRMSPFWRFVTAAVTLPVLWLVNFLASTVIPNGYVKYASGGFLDLLADAVNLVRKPATKAVGVVRFVRVDTGLGIDVPLGTVVQTAAIDGVVFELVTTAAAAFAGVATVLDVPVEAVAAGSAFNFAAGYFNVLPVPIVGVVSVANGVDWLVAPGTDVESDEALRLRVRNQFGTASSFHTDSVYRSLISGFPGVAIDAIWFEHSAPRGPGTANAWVLFDFSAPVVAYLAAINNFITDQGNHGHGDDLIVFQMPEHATVLVVSVWVDKFLSAEQHTAIHDAVVLFVGAAFRENKVYSPTLTLPYSRFSFSTLAGEMQGAIAGIHSVSFSLPDIVTAKWIPRLSTLTVNVSETE